MLTREGKFPILIPCIATGNAFLFLMKGEDQKLKVTFVDMASLRQHETLVSKKEKEVGFVYTYL